MILPIKWCQIWRDVRKDFVIYLVPWLLKYCFIYCKILILIGFWSIFSHIFNDIIARGFIIAHGNLRYMDER